VNLAPVFVECLAFHEALRKLEFPADEIYLSLYAEGRVQIHLLPSGGRFTIDLVNTWPGAAADFSAGWSSAARSWNGSMSDEERDRIYRTHIDEARFRSLVAALIRKGIVAPALRRLEETARAKRAN
jgi:uncharacterized protein (DUF2147 family)